MIFLLVLAVALAFIGWLHGWDKAEMDDFYRQWREIERRIKSGERWILSNKPHRR